MSFLFSSGLRSTIPDGAFAHYRFDDPSDTTTATDDIGTADATIDGATYVGSGKVGADSLSFGGSGDEVRRSSPFPEISESTDFTVFAWVKIDSSGSGEQGIVDNTNGSNNRFGIHYFHGSDKIEGRVFDGSGNSGTVSNPPLDTYIHVAAAWDSSNSELQVYVNANAGSTGSSNDITQDGTTRFVVGDADQGGIDYQGDIDEVILFNETLSQSQIQSYYDSTK